MAVVVDTLITRYEADPSGYMKGVASMNSSTVSLQGAISSLGGGISGAIPIMGQLAQAGLAMAGTLVAAITGVTAAFVTIGIGASKASADFDALRMSLESVVGGAENAKSAMKDLRDIAKAPGIGLEESIKGYTGLRRAGIDDQFAKSLLTEFANQNAMAGGGREEFSRLMTAVKQIASKPNLQGDEIMQLLEAGVPVHSMLQKQFGTSDTEALKKQGIGSKEILAGLVAQMSQMNRVGESAKNTMENLQSAIEQVAVQVGDGINSLLVPALSAFGSAIEPFAEGGAFATLGESVANQFQMLIEEFTGGGSLRESIASVLAGIDMLAGGVRNFWINVKGLFEFIWNAIKLIPGVGAIAGMGEALVKGSVLPAFQSSKSSYLSLAELGDAKVKQREAEKVKADVAQKSVLSDMKQNSKAQTEILKSIETNTKPLADFSRMILGGGPLGENGISAIQLGGMRGAHNKATRLIFEGIGMIVQTSMLDGLKSRP